MNTPPDYAQFLDRKTHVHARSFRGRLTASVNRKGVLDVDTVKGCAAGMAKHPSGGCYGLCYAARLAGARGFDFGRSVSREMCDGRQALFEFAGPVGDAAIWRLVESHALDWFRIGTMGDPSHDWPLTVQVCEWLCAIKLPVVVTKHWIALSDAQISALCSAGAIVNTSISALDDDGEREHRLAQYKRLNRAGVKSVLRIVSCEFGDTERGAMLRKIQRGLFENERVIDNPLRIPTSDPRVISGDIIARMVVDLGRAQSMSRFDQNTYVGHCAACPEQCGVNL